MGLGSGSSLAIVSGRTFSDNLAALKNDYPLNSSGYFGTKGKGRSKTRNIEASNPLKAAWDFAHLASFNPMKTVTIVGKGLRWTMRDGSVVSLRYYSSSDGSPAVELNVHNVPGVKSQKIHFVKKEGA